MAELAQKGNSENTSLFDRWIQEWADLVELEVVPVQESAEVVQVMADP